jgi:tRNA-dihydrouridine synthase
MLEIKPNPFFVLAPLDDVTDTVFRQIVADCSPPDLFFTEFVNVDGLQSPGRPHLLKKIQFTAKEQPLIAQLWGKNPDNFEKTAIELVEMGFVGIDLNMGCPVKTVIKNGCCSALINDRELALKIINAVKKGTDGKVPVSVKTRIGFNTVDLSWPKLLLEQDLDMLTIHGRTVKEMSKVPAHWDVIEEIRKMRDDISPRTKIVGNGDVVSREQGIELANKYGVDGVMIGRGVFGDPFVFSEKSPWQNYTKKQKVELFEKHVRLFVDTWGEKAEPVYVLNKFCKVYLQDFDGAKELREECMRSGSTTALLKVLQAASVK